MPTHTLSSNTHTAPREAKHASFTSLETRALKDDEGIEMYSRPAKNGSLREYPDEYGISQTSVNTRGPEEAGEHFYQYHYRPAKDDGHPGVARAI